MGYDYDGHLMCKEHCKNKKDFNRNEMNTKSGVNLGLGLQSILKKLLQPFPSIKAEGVLICQSESDETPCLAVP